jgi:hypothetical protein
MPTLDLFIYHHNRVQIHMYVRYRHHIQPILILGTGWAHPDVQILVFSPPGGASVVSAAIPVDEIMAIASQAAAGFHKAGAYYGVSTG